MDMEMRAFVTEVTRRAGALLLDYFRSETLQRGFKGAWDPVTEADRAAEALLVAAIRERFPQHEVLGEESGRLGTAGSMCWLIDPLDGTQNFSRGLPTWCVSVALAEHGDVRYGAVYDAMHDELFYAERGAGAFLDEEPIHTSGIVTAAEAVVYCKAAHGSREETTRRIAARLWNQVMRLRMAGSIGIALAAIAAGRMDAAMEPCGGPWDCAAGGLLVREAGGHTTDLDGKPMSTATSTVLAAATPKLHDALRALVYA